MTTKRISEDLYAALQDLDHALMDVMGSCLWDASRPVCDCGCGGDKADFEAARAYEAEFIEKLPELLEHVSLALAKQEAADAPNGDLEAIACGPVDKKLFIREMNRLLDAKGLGGCPDIAPPDGWDRECVKCAFKWREIDWGAACPACEEEDGLDAEAFARLKALLAVENDPDRDRKIIDRLKLRSAENGSD